ncbi:hypothetical protein LTR56_004437 [Elasticomyces elasticus]|nr:hypothetical protein LTR22_016852 [Elasticomyces elasticus]KAK3653583.1 hypothetical protein LTR56_004437 [Elasticomyces elasticus]KAK4916516.1 hypothetical protein LTR49_015484 [Elasticomyces elasticus]KAK5755772.1 hypothetical protein LTS12_014125 [Elasticomyces elasticus]
MQAVLRVPVRQTLARQRCCGHALLSPRQRRQYGDDKQHAFDGYLADLLDAPLRSVQPATRTPPAASIIKKSPKTAEEEKIAKYQNIFGSKADKSAERKRERERELESRSQLVAGVLIPPRPEEPDNCCMSGCINCVWELFRDEMEEWAMKSAEARSKQVEQRMQGKATGMMAHDTGTPTHVATSTDDDGGGRDTSWSGNDLGSGEPDLFADVPVGIREFMKTEKKLKQRRQKQ